MNPLKLQRIAFLLLTAVFIVFKVYILLAYISVYYVSFEYLNSNKKYKEMDAHRIYNWLYVAYLAFIAFVRGGLFHFPETVNYHLNTAEHLFFMFLICQTVLIYMEVFNVLRENYLFRLFAVFAALNLIGILNEYFQNLYTRLPLFILEENDLKDLKINLIGLSLFFITMLILNRKKIITDKT